MRKQHRKSELEATQQVVKFFETLLRASADGIVVTDATQSIVMVNDAFCNFFERQWREVVETSLFTWLEQFDDNAVERWVALEKKVHFEGSCRNVEFRMTAMDAARHFSVNASVLERVADEESGVTLSMWRDITDRKQAEEALRDSEARYRAIVTDQTELICRYNPDGTITFVNEACRRYFNKRPDELTGQSFWSFFLDEDHQKNKAHMASLGPDNPAMPAERCAALASGEYRWQQWTDRAIFDESGHLLECQSVGRDITDLKCAQEELKRMNTELEKRVDNRTREIVRANEKLRQEIKERKRVAKTLLKREKELQANSCHLEEVNTALKILLRQREQDKKDLEENILSNVRFLILPFIERLKQSRLNNHQVTCTEILQANVNQIVSPFLKKLNSRFLGLTPLEIKIASMVRAGKTTKEIAEILYLSVNTVTSYRYRLRCKFGLRNTKTNLHTFLQSLSD
jgi:PAS domain S-box-containing protein